MRYRVIYSSDQVQFEKMVEEAIMAGWELVGGVCPISHGNFLFFAQSLVLHPRYGAYGERLSE